MTTPGALRAIEEARGELPGRLRLLDGEVRIVEVGHHHGPRAFFGHRCLLAVFIP